MSKNVFYDIGILAVLDQAPQHTANACAKVQAKIQQLVQGMVGPGSQDNRPPAIPLEQEAFPPVEGWSVKQPTRGIGE